MRPNDLTALSTYIMVFRGMAPCSCRPYILQETAVCIT